MTLRATDVFTPGAFPTHTYVERSQEKIEESLRDAINTPGQIVSLSGPSKSGKTVLVERVVGRDNLIPVTGAGITRADQVWDRVLDWMDLPQSTSRGNSLAGKVGGEAGTKVGSSLLGFAKADVEAKASLELGAETKREAVHDRRGLNQVVDEIADSDFVLLLDDFHYMPRDVQVEVARSAKEAVRLGIRLVTAAVPHRGDDVVRALPELRGRVRSVDLSYWPKKQLSQIAEIGFEKLAMELPADAIARFASEAAGSPQLMQLICLNACFVLSAREKLLSRTTFSPSDVSIRDIFEQTSASTDFRSLIDVLDSGPRTRGTERKVYDFQDGSRGDVYRCVLKAIAADPPRLSFAYDDLSKRAWKMCTGEAPVGSSIVGTCLHMNKLALEKFPNERVIDWDEQKQIFDVPDPYLLFYLRWSERLSEVEAT
jgi:hypothetical protein